MKHFESINKGFNSTFKSGQLSLGLVIPIENYAHNNVPSLENHLERILFIEKLGFKTLWARDVPFNVPSFGDAGQTFDPFTYLGYIAAKTKDIALGIASIALPLHHPVHVAKSAATIDQLSNGRLILGVASGDRPDEYPAMGIDYEKRDELFREAFSYVRNSQDNFPNAETKHYGNLSGHIDVLPKATAHKIPMLITGSSRQSLEWNAKNGDGWMSYPKDLYSQNYTINQWRNIIEETQEFDKPFMQPLYIDLQENQDFKPLPIHLGFKTGLNYFIDYLYKLQDIGVNHLAINLRFNQRSIYETLDTLAEHILPEFHK